MSINYYVCKNCNDTFPDCGTYIKCESCFTHWCSEECAEEDGYISEHCKAHPDLTDRDLMEMYREKIVIMKIVVIANIMSLIVVSIVEKKISKIMNCWNMLWNY